MRRVLAFWEWEIGKWEERASKVMESTDLFSDKPTDEAKGKAAYAMKQASIRRSMIVHAQGHWQGLDSQIRSMVGHDPAMKVETMHK
jgi:hypothetical protein